MKRSMAFWDFFETGTDLKDGLASLKGAPLSRSFIRRLSDMDNTLMR